VGAISSTVDLLGGMSNIRSRAASNLYNSQYDFDQDINNLLSSANDGHLGIAPCSFVMPFLNPVPLVSLSTDGIAIPKLYTLGMSLIVFPSATPRCLYLTRHVKQVTATY
jgi:hypothetical protein